MRTPSHPCLSYHDSRCRLNQLALTKRVRYCLSESNARSVRRTVQRAASNRASLAEEETDRLSLAKFPKGTPATCRPLFSTTSLGRVPRTQSVGRRSLAGQFPGDDPTDGCIGVGHHRLTLQRPHAEIRQHTAGRHQPGEAGSRPSNRARMAPRLHTPPRHRRHPRGSPCVEHPRPHNGGKMNYCGTTRIVI